MGRFALPCCEPARFYSGANRSILFRHCRGAGGRYAPLEACDGTLPIDTRVAVHTTVAWETMGYGNVHREARVGNRWLSETVETRDKGDLLTTA